MLRGFVDAMRRHLRRDFDVQVFTADLRRLVARDAGARRRVQVRAPSGNRGAVIHLAALRGVERHATRNRDVEFLHGRRSQGLFSHDATSINAGRVAPAAPPVV
jgi:hypothetical protein